MSTLNRPIILTVDDDIEINALISRWLSDMNCNVISYTTPKDFLSNFKSLAPRLCIVDINIGAPGDGFKIIQAVRNVLGSSPPIIVLSADGDPKAIAHAIDIGADDYLVKPPSKITLREKVEVFLDVTQLEQKDIKRGIPEEFRDTKVLIDIFVEEIDEFGVKIRGDELLSKGTVLLLNSDFFAPFIEDNKPILGTVISNWIHAEDRTAGAFIEFDPENERFLTKIRAWISGSLRQ